MTTCHPACQRLRTDPRLGFHRERAGGLCYWKRSRQNVAGNLDLAAPRWTQHSDVWGKGSGSLWRWLRWRAVFFEDGCAEWVRMCWSCWMIELNRTELNWTELNSTELNWIELNLFDCTDWLQLSIFKPKRPSIEWCMLFYARVTREWCEKIFIFFSILECVGTSGSERFCDLVVYIRYTRRESPHQGFHWLLTKSAGKDYTAFFPASAWNPRVMGPDIPDPTWVL